MKEILITGGAGFIGSTVGSALQDQGYEIVILDNFSTGRREYVQERTYYEGDIADGELLDKIFEEHPAIDLVIHCAASIVVPESVENPIAYYKNNVVGTLRLVESLVRNGCHRLLFSSSASVYEVPENFEVTEESDLKPMSPYARTKAHVERMLEDVSNGSKINTISLRYFNPIGNDPKMRTGLALRSPTHVLGKIIEADQGRTNFTVTGTSYLTRDGSGIRDYIHVWDLALAHVAVVKRFDSVLENAGESYRVFNLGTGTGTTVFELVDIYESVTGRAVNVKEGAPRLGDQAGSYAVCSRASEELGWTASFTVEDGVRDTLKWLDVRNSVLTDLT